MISHEKIWWFINHDKTLGIEVKETATIGGLGIASKVWKSLFSNFLLGFNCYADHLNFQLIQRLVRGLRTHLLSFHTRSIHNDGLHQQLKPFLRFHYISIHIMYIIYIQVAWYNLTKSRSSVAAKLSFSLCTADCGCAPARLRCGAGGSLGSQLGCGGRFRCWSASHPQWKTPDVGYTSMAFQKAGRAEIIQKCNL